MGKHQIHLQGFLEINEYCGIQFEDDDDNIPMEIAKRIPVNYKPSKNQATDESSVYYIEESLNIPNVSIRFYVSDDKIALEEAIERLVLCSIGELDIYVEWFGYSEFTKLGLDVKNFTIGNHDLEDILRNYVGKYVHLIVEID